MSGAFVVGIGGSVRPGSSTESAIRMVLRSVEAGGHRTWLCSGARLLLPPYADGCDPGPDARELLANVRRADAVVVGSPGYHGSMSGLVKNALDHLEALRDDDRPYLQGRAVGCVSTAYGWQAAVMAMTALRQVVHALRGWPTPYGLAINVREQPIGWADGGPSRAVQGAELMARELLQFAAGGPPPAALTAPAGAPDAGAAG